MKDRTIAIIQARSSSTRLPKKVLKNLAGKPMIYHIVERAKFCKNVDEVIVATSTEESDDELANYCNINNINLIRGSLNNVLERFKKTLEKFPADYFVRITGDCPLICPIFIDKQIDALKLYDADFIKTNVQSSLVEGQGVNSKKTLELIYNNTSDKDDLEHVGSKYISKNLNKFRIVKFNLPRYLCSSNYRITVDEPKDYELISKIYKTLYKGKPFDLRDAIYWLENNPEEAKLNRDISHSKINKILIKKIESSKINYCGIVNW